MHKIKRRIIPIGGGSIGIIIPKLLAEMLSMSKGDVIEISLVRDQLIIKK